MNAAKRVFQTSNKFARALRLGWLFVALSLGAIGVFSTRARKPVTFYWVKDYPTALAFSAQTGKPVLAEFSAVWCEPCRELEHKTLTDSEVKAISESFVCVQIDADHYPDLVTKFRINGIPATLFLTSEGIPYMQTTGFVTPESYLGSMKSALSAYPKKARP